MSRCSSTNGSRAAPPALAVHAVTRPRADRARLGRGGPRRHRSAGASGRPLPGHVRARAVPGHRPGAFRGVRARRRMSRETGRCGWSPTAGSIRPTAASTWRSDKGSTPAPRGLALEAQDEAGRWVVVAPDLGFPAGKNKTILIDLSNAIGDGAARARRLRLRTNLEVYWDWLAVANAVENPALVTTRLQPTRAELRYRGFSQTSHETARSPGGAAVRADRERRPALARSGRLLHALRRRASSCSIASTTAT